MFSRISSRQYAATTALDAAIASARAGFVCVFSSADEFERALISERRAKGYYGRPSLVPIGLFVGLTLVVAGTALLMI